MYIVLQTAEKTSAEPFFVNSPVVHLSIPLLSPLCVEHSLIFRFGIIAGMLILFLKLQFLTIRELLALLVLLLSGVKECTELLRLRLLERLEALFTLTITGEF